MGGKSSKQKNQRASTLNQAGVNEEAVKDYKKKFALTDEQILKYLEYFVAKRDKSNRITEETFVSSLTEVNLISHFVLNLLDGSFERDGKTNVQNC